MVLFMQEALLQASAKEYMIFFPHLFSGELFQGAGVVIQLDLVTVYSSWGRVTESVL